MARPKSSTLIACLVGVTAIASTAGLKVRAAELETNGAFSLKVTKELEIPVEGTPSALAWSPDGSTLAVSSNYGATLSVFDSSGAALSKKSGISGLYPNDSLAFAGGSTQVVYHPSDHDDAMTSLILRDSASGQVTKEVKAPYRAYPSAGYAVSIDQKLTALATSDSVLLYDTSDWHVLLNLHGMEQVLSSVCISPDKRFIVTGTRSGDVLVFDAASGKLLRNMPLYHSDYGNTFINSVAVNPANDLVLAAAGGETFNPNAFASDDGARKLSVDAERWKNSIIPLQLRRISDGQPVAAFTTAAMPIVNAAWDPKGRYIAVINAENKLFIWQPSLQNGGYRMFKLPAPVTSMAIRQDDGAIAIGAGKSVLVFSVK